MFSKLTQKLLPNSLKKIEEPLSRSSKDNIPRDLVTKKTSVIYTGNLGADSLGYSNSIRSPEERQIDLFALLVSDINIKIKDTILLSKSGFGSKYIAMLGKYRGRSVAMLTPRVDLEYADSQENQHEFNTRVRGTVFLSDLGIGPKYHGIYVDKHTLRKFLVVDIATGEFIDKDTEIKDKNFGVCSRVNQQTYKDFTQSIERLKNRDYNYPPSDSFQYLIDKNGRITFIDGAGWDGHKGRMPSEISNTFNSELAVLVARSPTKLAKEFLANTDEITQKEIKEYISSKWRRANSKNSNTFYRYYERVMIELYPDLLY